MIKSVLAATMFAALSLSLSAETTPAPDPATTSESADAKTEGGETKEKPKFTVDFGVSLQLDYAWYDDARGDGGEIRRARLSAKGDIAEHWDYKIEFDFAGDEPELRDGYIRYEGLGPGTLWLGNYKQPTSLEVLSSSKHTTFLERAFATELAEGRRIGIGYKVDGAHYVAMASLFGDEANGAAEGNGIAGRAVWIPVNAGSRVVHLGGWASRDEPQSETARFRVRPESHVTDTRVLDTRTIADVDSILHTGVEAAVVYNRFSAQAEWTQSDVSRTGSNPDLTFDGWYAFGSFFLTPDKRAYKASDAAFDKVKPTQKGGAWEVALRYSTMDLTDRTVTGGAADAITFGLNWYPNDYLRFMANYVAVDSDEVAGDDDPSVFQVRMQIAF